MRLTNCCAAILSLCFTSFAMAGVQYTQVNRSDGEGANSTNEIMLDGTRFKSVFTSSDNPMMGAGFYVLATGPGAIYMVNPTTGKYARFSPKDMQKMQQDIQQMDPEFAGQMQATVKDFKASKDLDEAGPTILGLPTQHYRYSISYQEVYEIPGAPMKMTTNVKEINEFWATSELSDLANPEGWMDSGSGQSNSQLEEIERQMAGHGFVVKRVVTREDKMGGMMAAMAMGGGADKTTMEVTALNRDATFPAGTFDLPEGFTEVDFANLMNAGTMPDLNSVPGENQNHGMPNLDDEPKE